ncbi:MULTISPECIES: DCC1-like thiol-disulfide oxidoreductase family protein [Methylocaldum]|uniref:DCC1-like thiol-disulfide oxidoreductase family protein n=1 Tax=unclassified Methylocaldum TaxID=2622260 RepID=UPI001B5764D2|nr:putative DCC family thiol-disulfide oxidoreductase YuxK [Methylocaldum sp. RMAD-M]
MALAFRALKLRSFRQQRVTIRVIVPHASNATPNRFSFRIPLIALPSRLIIQAMYRKLKSLVEQGLAKQVPATGLGAFRIGFSLVILQEIVFLFYFRHLIFDPVPFFDRASPILHFFLLAWICVAACLVVGYHTRRAAVANYVFWVTFVVFTPMWQDFDGGFDQLMTGSSFLLMFLPTERALSLDNLRRKLRHSTLNNRYEPQDKVTVLAYYIPLAISLGLLYLDSGIHKLSADFWRNGMGPWLPPTMPYYMSAIDMTPLLNIKSLEMFIGYTIIVFQFAFLFLFWFRLFRVPLLLTGTLFHTGIVLSLNIYPFGFAMLVHYFLLVPFRWWRNLKKAFQFEQPGLTVFYDQQCPLCNRTVIVIQHFDILKAVDFKGLQTNAKEYRELDSIPENKLLQDLYALDGERRLYSGLDTYIRILVGMGYTAPVGWLMRLPGIYHLGNRCYRRIADRRERIVCDEACAVQSLPPPIEEHPFAQWYQRYAATTGQQTQRIAKFLIVVLMLQLNSTIHYGILYRCGEACDIGTAGRLLDHLSNSVINFSHAFLGITPHALYMHDHFAGYNHILALTYKDQSGREQWLPFVNEEGRLVAPNWGRVQSMWANVAVTSHMHQERLSKFLKKVTAFWGTELGLDLSNAEFLVKLKEVRVPMDWEDDLRHKNIAQPWRDVGKVIWQRGNFRVELPNIDIETL